MGHTSQSHTHDLGHEIFLILQGQAEFTIEGHAEVLGPGQMCIALTDEMHQVRNVGDKPVIMYLSVTPHIQPTHTMWNEDGTKQPPRFVLNTGYDVEPDRETPTDELLDQQLAAKRGWRRSRRVRRLSGRRSRPFGRHGLWGMKKLPSRPATRSGHLFIRHSGVPSRWQMSGTALLRALWTRNIPVPSLPATTNTPTTTDHRPEKSK